MSLFHILKMEFLKLKRSYVWVLMCCAPLLMIIFGAYNFIRYQDVFLQGNAIPWQKLLGQIVTFYALLLLPLSIAVMGVWLARIEHSDNNWKHLFTLPLGLKSVYLAKIIIQVLLVGLSMFIFFFGTIIAAYIDGVRDVPIQTMAANTLICWVTCLPILAIQMLLSIRFSNIGIPIGIGLGASVIGVVITNTSYGRYYFWSLPSLTLMPNSEGVRNLTVSYTLCYSVISFLCLLIIGYIVFRKQKV